MSLVPFYIPNSSPLLSYSPCVDCGPQGWQSAYTPRPDGFDQTFHQITGEGHTVSFNLASNGFGITHATVAPECPLEYSINGSDFRSTCVSDFSESGSSGGLTKLDYGRHEVVLRTGNVTIFQLFGISGNYILPEGQTVVNRTLDNGSEGLVYTPRESWNFIHDNGTLEGNMTLLDDFSDQGGSKTSVAVTDMAASVDMTFTGSTIFVYGLSGPECGEAQVKVDDVVVADLNMTSNWKTPGALLYTAGGLDGSRPHRLSIANTLSGKQLVLDYAIITGTRAAKASPANSAPLIAGVVGGIVLIILLGIVLYFYLIARMKYKLRPSTAGSSRSGSGPAGSKSGSSPGSGSGHGHGHGQKTRPNLKVDSWRKQTPLQSADVCSPIDTYHTESTYGGILGPLATVAGGAGRDREKLKKQASGHWPIAKLYTRKRERGQSFATLRSDCGGTNLSAPSFPDYIPYQSPFAASEFSHSQSRSVSGSRSRTDSQLATSNAPRHGHSPLTTATATRSSRMDRSVPVTPKSGLTDQIMDRSSGKKSPVTPPGIVGLDSSAERWLQENTYAGQAQPSSQGQGRGQPVRSSSGKSHRSGSRASRGHSFLSHTEYEPGSPIQEGFEIVSITHHAQNARRSVARLWHTPDAVPSLYRSESLTIGSKSHDIPLKRSNTLSDAMDVVQAISTKPAAQAQAAAVTANQTVPVSASLTATAGMSSTNDSFQSFIRPSPSTTSSYAFTRPQIATTTSSPYVQPGPYSSSAKRPATPYTPSSSNNGGANLRRGVSIKSVKSFFSGWAKPGSGGEGSSSRSENETPRPDSGIFPLAFTHTRSHSHSHSQSYSHAQSLGLGSVDVPLPTCRSGSGSGSGSDGTRSGSANMFIELDPESPLTASRPPSEWPMKQKAWGSRV